MGRYIQLIPGIYRSDKHFFISGIDKVHLKCDCSSGSIVSGVREPILYSFGLDKTPGHKNCKDPRIQLLQKYK